MYVILAKVEVVKKVIGPFLTKDSATAARRELMKSTNKLRFVVRNVEAPLSEAAEEMETLWQDD